MRNKMQLAALRVKDFAKRDVTVIHTLLRPDEIRDPDFPVLDEPRMSDLLAELEASVKARRSGSDDTDGHHELSNGIATSSDVPLPAGLAIRIRPPRASTRSRSPMSPEPLPKSAPPIPSSLIDKERTSSLACPQTATWEARACLAALVRASDTT
jgi:hypothetical protein